MNKEQYDKVMSVADKMEGYAVKAREVSTQVYETVQAFIDAWQSGVDDARSQADAMRASAVWEDTTDSPKEDKPFNFNTGDPSTDEYLNQLGQTFLSYYKGTQAQGTYEQYAKKVEETLSQMMNNRKFNKGDQAGGTQ